jgi:hypothetical protein
MRGTRVNLEQSGVVKASIVLCVHDCVVSKYQHILTLFSLHLFVPHSSTALLFILKLFDV